MQVSTSPRRFWRLTPGEWRHTAAPELNIKISRTFASDKTPMLMTLVSALCCRSQPCHLPDPLRLAEQVFMIFHDISPSIWHVR